MDKRLSLLFLLVNLCTFDLNSSYLLDKPSPIVNYLSPINTPPVSSGIEPIECVYMINLNIRPERWIRAKNIFDKRGIYLNRATGFNGWALSQREKKELAGPYPINISGGLYGCLISHVSVLKDAYIKGFNIVWIMEDDVSVVGRVHRLPKIIKELNKIDPTWDILYTDLYKGCNPRNLLLYNRPNQEIPSKHYFAKKFKPIGPVVQTRHRRQMHSYIVSNRGIRKLIEYFTHVYVWTSYGRDVHYVPGIRQYSVIDDITVQWVEAGSDTKPESKLNISQKKRDKIYCKRK